VKLAVLLALAAALLAAQDTATVEGMVINKVTGAGIEGVTVSLWSSNTNSFKAVTDEAGVFQIRGLKPGDYSSSVQKNRYASPSSELSQLLDDGPKHHISPGANRFRFELIPPAVLRGRVIGTDGNPAKATVVLGWGEPVSTDAGGRFAFETVWPGRYTLLARPSVTQHLYRKDEIRVEPVLTYYPAVQDRSLAETIIVPAGAELNGYEIRVQSAEVHRVRGVVLDPEGKPVAKATVKLQARIPGGSPLFWSSIVGPGRLYFRGGPIPGSDPEESFKTGDDGAFEFPSVRTGEWTVNATQDLIPDEIHGGVIVYFGRASFRLEHTDPDELMIQMETPFSISGVVVLDDGSPLPQGVSPTVSLTSQNTGMAWWSSPEKGGVLRFGLVSGTYQIGVDVQGGRFYADSIWLGSTNVTGQSVELTPASPPIKVLLKPAGTLRGTTEEAKAGTVLFFPQNLTGGGYLIQSGAEGTFELAGIPSGNYYAIALDGFDPRTMGDPAHLRDLIPRATSVRVEQGSTASVLLKVNHAPE